MYFVLTLSTGATTARTLTQMKSEEVIRIIFISYLFLSSVNLETSAGKLCFNKFTSSSSIGSVTRVFSMLRTAAWTQNTGKHVFCVC